VVRVAEVPTPVPKDAEVLIRVRAATVGAADSVARRGSPIYARLFFGLRRPRFPILGSDFAGEVEAIGPAVTRFAVGDQVFGAAGPRLGAHAEFVCVSEQAALVAKPVELTHAEAVALADATALCFLRDKAKLHKGQTILVNGASGSVGSAAVQLARHFGATVTAVCSGPNSDLVSDLGADKVIEYTVEDFTRNGQIYDVIFDAVGKSSFSRCRASLAPGGIYLTTVPTIAILVQTLWTSRFGSKRAAIAFTGLRPPDQKARDLTYTRDLIAARKIVPVVDSTFPLSRIADAYRRVDPGHKHGNVIVTMD
jgi:NADPH:quinone reductase-like Zn-dependent oxidoreductase